MNKIRLTVSKAGAQSYHLNIKINITLFFLVTGWKTSYYNTIWGYVNRPNCGPVSGPFPQIQLQGFKQPPPFMVHSSTSGSLRSSQEICPMWSELPRSCVRATVPCSEYHLPWAIFLSSMFFSACSGAQELCPRLLMLSQAAQTCFMRLRGPPGLGFNLTSSPSDTICPQTFPPRSTCCSQPLCVPLSWLTGICSPSSEFSFLWKGALQRSLVPKGFDPFRFYTNRFYILRLCTNYQQPGKEQDQSTTSCLT